MMVMKTWKSHLVVRYISGIIFIGYWMLNNRLDNKNNLMFSYNLCTSSHHMSIIVIALYVTVVLCHRYFSHNSLIVSIIWQICRMHWTNRHHLFKACHLLVFHVGILVFHVGTKYKSELRSQSSNGYIGNMFSCSSLHHFALM